MINKNLIGVISSKPNIFTRLNKATKQAHVVMGFTMIKLKNYKFVLFIAFIISALCVVELVGGVV